MPNVRRNKRRWKNENKRKKHKLKLISMCNCVKNFLSRKVVQSTVKAGLDVDANLVKIANLNNLYLVLSRALSLPPNTPFDLIETSARDYIHKIIVICF